MRKKATQPRPIYSKVRGVSHENPDGSRRQALIKRCRAGQELVLVREPDNEHDENAVMVCTKGGFLRRSRQLGYLSEDLAAQLADELDAGRRIVVTVQEVTGGGGALWWKKNYGLNIIIMPQ